MGTYSYDTGLSYTPTSPRQDISSSFPQLDGIYQRRGGADWVRQSSDGQAESQCYLYPESYNGPVDPWPTDNKPETEVLPPLPMRPPQAVVTRGDTYAAPIPKKPFAPPSSTLDRAASDANVNFVHDPRTRSTESIPPVPPPHKYFSPKPPIQESYESQARNSSLIKKRNLLLVYIHGFLGSTASFNHFPSHLHNLLSYLLSASCPHYTVHTKVYPRFKTRYSIGDAAEMLSQWLSEFEDEDEVPGRKALRPATQEGQAEETDIILLGHSMGGLLAGEVVLLPRLHPVKEPGVRPYRHRILGLVGFDSPFLGMHPGIISSGISSLFRPSPKPDKRKDSVPEPPQDELYAEDLFLRKHPEHFDTGIQPRSDAGNRGFRNFLIKYSGNIPGATIQYVLSHMEFAACLADPVGLMTRYRKLRALEDGMDLSTPGGTGEIGGYRVRLVNYYTVCTGRIKEKVTNKENRTELNTEDGMTGTYDESKRHSLPQPLSPVSRGHHQRGSSTTSVPATGDVRTSFTSVADAKLSIDYEISPPSSTPITPRSSTSTPPPLPPLHTESSPGLPEQLQMSSSSTDPIAILNARSEKYSLPPIPPAPVQPILHSDLSHIVDPKLQKAHMKENKGIWKEHFRQVKVHGKLIKDREKVLSKLEKKAAECPNPYSQAAKGKGKGGWEMEIPKVEFENLKKKEKVKERRFCLIPKEAKDFDGLEDSKLRDETWIKVPMGHVDEVGAHCGLFMTGTEIFETSANSQKSNIITEGGVDPKLATGIGRMSVDVELDDEKQELEAKRRQYEKLVGDLAERIELWVKEHVGVLGAMETAGQGMNIKM